MSLTANRPLPLFRHRLNGVSEIWSQYLWASRPGAKGITSACLAQGRKAKSQRHCENSQCEESIFSHATLFHRKFTPIQELDCSPQPTACHSFFSESIQAGSIRPGRVTAGTAHPVSHDHSSLMRKNRRLPTCTSCSCDPRAICCAGSETLAPSILIAP
jgi:hypothetical protein